MAGSGTGGVATAVAAALEAQEGLSSDPAREPDQPDLWAETEGAGAGPLDAVMAMGTALFGKPRNGAGGRPRGSQNRQTVEFRKLFLSKHRHPVLVLGDFYSVPVEELAARLGTKDLLAVAKFQKECALAAAPYVEKRQPIDVAVKQERGLTLVIGDLSGAAQAQGATIDGDCKKVEQYQELSFALAPADGTGPLASDGNAQQDQWLTGHGKQIVNPPDGIECDMIAHDTSSDPPPDRDPGAPPPGDDPPV